MNRIFDPDPTSPELDDLRLEWFRLSERAGLMKTSPQESIVLGRKMARIEKKFEAILAVMIAEKLNLVTEPTQSSKPCCWCDGRMRGSDGGQQGSTLWKCDKNREHYLFES